MAGTLVEDERLQVSAASRDSSNERTVVFDAVEDDIFAHRKAAQIRAQVMVSPPTEPGIPGEERKAVCDFVDLTIGYFDAAAFSGDVAPNAIKLGLSGQGNAITHLAVVRLSRKPRHTPLIDLIG